MEKLKWQLYLPWSLAFALALLKVRLLCAQGSKELPHELCASSLASRAAGKAEPSLSLLTVSAQQGKLVYSKYLVGKARLLPTWACLHANCLGTAHTGPKWHESTLAFRGVVLLRNDMPIGPLPCPTPPILRCSLCRLHP